MSPSRIAIAFLQRTSPRNCLVGNHHGVFIAHRRTTTTSTLLHTSGSSRRRQGATFLTYESEIHHLNVHDQQLPHQEQWRSSRPVSLAFGECEIAALSDLFLQFAKTQEDGDAYLNLEQVRALLESVGERPDDATLQSLVADADVDGSGRLRLDDFLRTADRMLGEAPARIVLVVGGPGSGKGELCSRLASTCGAVHLSCGEMLRAEVASDTPLGREVADIMSRGDLVSSAVVTALMRRRMRHHPGRRILLDGFPRSLENARDFVELCGPPELALHLNCDDTVMIDRIISRAVGRTAVGDVGAAGVAPTTPDDTVHTAIQRLKNYHKHRGPTMSWLKEIRVPIVELDCSGSKEDVWGQLTAIGRLMRPAVKLPVHQASNSVMHHSQPPLKETVYENFPKDDAKEDMQWFA